MNTTYNIRIDSERKKQADRLFRKMGLTLSAAVNIFITQAIIQERFPIENIVAEPFYAEELTATLEEFERDKAEGRIKSYATIEEAHEEVWDEMRADGEI